MDIVIAGAGEVGTHLANMLSKQEHNIMLIDSDEEKLELLGNQLDVMSIVGSCTSIGALKDAGVHKCDLFIAVNHQEDQNINSAILAKKLGAKQTIARVNNSEYLEDENKEYLKMIGIDSLIYPEMLAAKEIVTAVRRPWTRQYWEVFGGALILIGVKVRDNSRLVNKHLSELLNEQKLYHIVAIKRQNETIIPRGTDRIESGDIVFFTTTKSHIEDVRLHAGKRDPEVKKVIIMGGSRIAIRTCQYLPNNIRVKVIETNKEKSHRIAEVVPGNVLIINGDGRDTDLLMQEGIKDAQAFIALTDNSSTNILACLAAKRAGVFKTIAKIENIDYIPLAESMDIGSVINKKLIAASHIYQFLLDADVSNVKCLTFANADVAELVARPDSKITRKQVKDLNLPKDLTLGGLIRDGEPMMIKGDTHIQAYDHVVVFCLDTAMRKLEDYFN